MLPYPRKGKRSWVTHTYWKYFQKIIQLSLIDFRSRLMLMTSRSHGKPWWGWPRWYGWRPSACPRVKDATNVRAESTLEISRSNMTRYNAFQFNCSLYPRPTKLEGGILDSPCPSVRLSVRPSVCRRHGFRSISQVCFGISISNFICVLMVAIGRSLLIFSVVTFKMAAWRPYWIFWFPDSNFSLALNINFKLQRHNTYVYG